MNTDHPYYNKFKVSGKEAANFFSGGKDPGKTVVNLEKLDRADGRNDNKLVGKKKSIAKKMARTLDGASSSGFPKHGGDRKHGLGKTKGLAF